MIPSRVLVVLPAYNEEANIGRLLDKIEETMVGAGFLYHVIVVDDGSRDGTYEILSRHARRIPLTINRHPANEGLGAAIRDGLLAAADAAEDDDIVITMDADETHTPGLIGCLVTMVHDGHDVVIASRYQPGARVYGVPVARMFFSYVASWSFRVLFPTRGIRDFTSGYPAWSIFFSSFGKWILASAKPL
jgi:dolichol-phosphate mannosyltransferase